MNRIRTIRIQIMPKFSQKLKTRCRGRIAGKKLHNRGKRKVLVISQHLTFFPDILESPFDSFPFEPLPLLRGALNSLFFQKLLI